MTQSPKSQRQLLFSRVQKQRIADSLTKNLQQLSKTQERMVQSRISSASSSSLHSLRRAYSTASVNKKSSSKQKMLREIIQKLRNSKKLVESSPINSFQRQQKELNSTNDKKSVKGKVNKLEQMMKDIKKCNQMSTKAIYSIKKNINEQISTPNKREQNNLPNMHEQNNSVIFLINQLASLKQQLLKIKQENNQLVGIIKQQRESNSKEECTICYCKCHGKDK